jgi:hypothetical protein
VEEVGEGLAKEELGELGAGLGEKNYSTKTGGGCFCGFVLMSTFGAYIPLFAGDRHIEPARVAERGHCALFSPKPTMPSQRTTHLVYFLTHPAENEMGDVQKDFSIYFTASFIVQMNSVHLADHVQQSPAAQLQPQVRNPTSSQNPAGKHANYLDEIVQEQFGGAADKGPGRKFVAVNPPGLMDFSGAQLLLIADKSDAKEILEEEKAEQGGLV